MAAMSTRRLNDTSYAVLGLVEMCGEATPYQLKQIAEVSLFHFWSIPHTQLYTESARLADLGLLDEIREQAGRRRRLYRLTAAGRKALRDWRGDVHTDMYELRDPGLLKLFFGADPRALAEAQLGRHRERLASYQRQATQPGLTEPTRLALESGIGHAREYVRFWSRLASAAKNEPDDV
jgi:DNA-binding PadR family transcriptional regulator